ncbi:hypothetical protein ACROHD_19395, partial [Nioella aestuarii]
SGLCRLFAILCPPFPKHNGGPIQKGHSNWPFPAQTRLHVQKKTLVATERRRARVRKQREDWISHRLPAVSARPERVVFIDETLRTNVGTTSRLPDMPQVKDRML